MTTKDANYPTQAYHDRQDAAYAVVESKFMFVQREMNEYVELFGSVGVDAKTQQFCDPTPHEFVGNLVQFHNRCVENIIKGQSVARYTALLQECRVRMKGVLASDTVLQQVPGLLPLDLR